MATELKHWHDRLAAHFATLREHRCADGVVRPIFGLEHGLNPAEIEALEGAIRAYIVHARPTRDQALAWIVYSSELGYRYSGAEYWQTFEDETPGWTLNGDRYRIRHFYRQFQRDFGGAVPSGPWAEHFSIICWPITHAILPKDLQRQLAQILYESRHSFSGDVLRSPELLGEFIAARSWNTSLRFQNLAQETELLGQIAAALLFQGVVGSTNLILSATLERISEDMDRERRAREWLRSARQSANDRVQVRGLGRFRRSNKPPTIGSLEEARREIELLGIEPRLVLRPSAPSSLSWDVSLEIPDLSRLLLRFPETKGTLTGSRCEVAGSSGRPLARGRLLYGPQRVRLARWPQPDEVLLKFDRSNSQLDYLLRTECLLRPSHKWLFRIASDGLAYEHKGLRVRPGQRYIIASTAGPIRLDRHTNPVDLACEGVHGAILELPQALTRDWQESIKALGLGQARNIEVWPAGLSAVAWDGEGHGEWFASERPYLAILADHPLTSLRISMDGNLHRTLELTSVKEGEPVFVELPQLTVGVHRLNFSVQSDLVGNSEDLNDLQAVIRIREDRPQSPFVDYRGPLSVQIEPEQPTLEQLWEGEATISLRGPRDREVGCLVSLFESDDEPATITRVLPPINLPFSSEDWEAHFGQHFRHVKRAQEAYDRAYVCTLEFSAQELGAFTLRCERDFTPLRWAVTREGDGHILQLYDDSGNSEQPQISHAAFKTPCVEEPLAYETRLLVSASGGLYIARSGEHVATTIVPQVLQGRGFPELRLTPEVDRSARSLDSVLRIVEKTALWGRARLSGDLLSAMRQQSVRDALLAELFRLICGANWARVEAEFASNGKFRTLEALSRAISRNMEEASVGAYIIRDAQGIARSTPDYRVRLLATLAIKHRLLPDRLRRMTANTPDGDGINSPMGLSELALRLASDPATVEAWAGEDVRVGLTQLLETPSLARSARFLVIATDFYSPIESQSEDAHAGWRWE